MKKGPAYIGIMFLLSVGIGCRVQKVDAIDKSVEPGTDQTTSTVDDPADLERLQSFQANHNYFAASFYLAKNNVNDQAHKAFMTFFIDGSLQGRQSGDVAALRALASNLANRDLDAEIIEKLNLILKNNPSSFWLYPTLARLNIRQTYPFIKTKFSSQTAINSDPNGNTLLNNAKEFENWQAAIALAIWQDEEAISFIIETCERLVEVNRVAVYLDLISSIVNIKSKRITDYIINEFILSDRCYDLNDPGVVPWCETDIAYAIDVIENLNSFKLGFEAGGRPGREALRSWFRKLTDWNYTKN